MNENELHQLKPFRLTINPAIEKTNKTIGFPFASKEEMEASSNNLADMLLFLQDSINVMPDYSNIFIREEFINGEWVEIE